MCAKKVIYEILQHVAAKSGKHVGNIIGDSVITCDEIKEETETIPTKNILTKTVPTKSTLTKFLYFYILFIDYDSIADSCSFSICHCVIKYQTKQRHLWSCHNNYKLKEIDIKNIL